MPTATTARFSGLRGALRRRSRSEERVLAGSFALAVGATALLFLGMLGTFLRDLLDSDFLGLALPLLALSTVPSSFVMARIWMRGGESDAPAVAKTESRPNVTA